MVRYPVWDEVGDEGSCVHFASNKKMLMGRW